MSLIVVGVVKTCEAVKDKLKAVEVNVGREGEFVTVVTNAPNVREGSRVAVALCGAELPDGTKVGKQSVGGRQSEGMLCDSAMLGWSGGAAGIAAQMPDEVALGERPPASKPRRGGVVEDAVPELSAKELKKLEKEKKKKALAEKRAARKGSKCKGMEEGEEEERGEVVQEQEQEQEQEEGGEGEKEGGKPASVFTSMTKPDNVEKSCTYEPVANSASASASALSDPKQHPGPPRPFNRSMHVAYFRQCLKDGFPHYYTSMDTQRITAVYFALSGLDILGALDSIDSDRMRDAVYAWQLPSLSEAHSGFVGTNCFGQRPGGCLCICGGEDSGSGSPCVMTGHLAMTYASLASLVILGDRQLSKVDRPALVAQVRALQQPDGCFAASAGEGEQDLRFVYCACVISHLLGNWDGVNIDAAWRFILSCVTYEGGLALRPGGEAHGGSCYCGLAALVLMGKLEEAEVERPHFTRALHEYCLHRQVGGYQGRTNKDPDSCYSFWLGATLRLLGVDAFTDTDLQGTEYFLLEKCQSDLFGGFSKLPGSMPDILHSYYSLCWLAMSAQADAKGGEEGTRMGATLGYSSLRAIDVATGLCTDRL